MALVTMTCPNCGGALQPNSNGEAQFDCPYWHTTVLNIVDAKINGDIETIDVDSFVKQIKEQRRQFVIHIDKQYKVIDVETAVINEKLQQAEKLLEKGQWGTLQYMLADIPNNIVAAARMKLLARVACRNEYELTLKAARLDSPEYQNLLSVCDEETAQSYRKLHDICLENLEIEQEISKVTQFFDGVRMYKEAYAYALNMCEKYPSNICSWEKLKWVKQQIDCTYANCAPVLEDEIIRVLKKYIQTADSREDVAAAQDELKGADALHHDAVVVCAKCGIEFHMSSQESVCPHCSYEQSNDDILQSAAHADERVQTLREKTCALWKRISNRMVRVCAIVLFVLIAELIANASGVRGVTPEATMTVVGIANTVLLLLVLCNVIAYWRSSGAVKKEYALLSARCDLYGITQVNDKAGDVYQVAVFPQKLAASRKGLLIVSFVALALIVGVTFAIGAMLA